jgi:hypothetical protein
VILITTRVPASDEKRARASEIVTAYEAWAEANKHSSSQARELAEQEVEEASEEYDAWDLWLAIREQLPSRGCLRRLDAQKGMREAK